MDKPPHRDKVSFIEGGYFANLFTPNRSWLWGVIRKCFLIWMIFTAYNKELETKLAEKMGREYPAGQLFCNTNAALV